MPRIHTPINLKQFTIQDPKITPGQVRSELYKMLEWITREQKEYYQSHKYEDLLENLNQGEIQLKGSLNSLGRSLNIEPIIDYKYQAFNLKEMYRTNILTRISSQRTSLQLYELLHPLLNQGEPVIPKQVIEEYKKEYPGMKLPTEQYIINTLERLKNGWDGSIINTPARVLPFWATDMHYSSLKRVKHTVYWTVKLYGMGKITLEFKLPKKERFNQGKLTRPTVYENKKGDLMFGFTLQDTVDKPVKYSDNVLGVDLGVIQPFTGSIMNKKFKEYSNPFYPNKQVNLLTGRINSLYDLTNKLYLKEQKCKNSGRTIKQEILYQERRRIREKITRLKHERAHHVTNQLVSIALDYNASLLLEDLSWTPTSTWEHSLMSKQLEVKVIRNGVRLLKTSAKDTSKQCSACKSKNTKTYKRLIKCYDCGMKLDRDVNASRNIASKKLVKFKLFKRSLSLHTRVTYPVIPGFSPVNTIISAPGSASNTT